MMQASRRLCALLVLVLLCLTILPGPAYSKRAGSDPDLQLQLSVRSSKEASYRTAVEIRSPKWSDWMRHLEQVPAPVPSPAYSIVELQVTAGTDRQVYEWNGEDELLFKAGPSADGYAYRPPEAMRQELKGMTEALIGSHYGKLVDWEQAKALFPRKAYMTIIDLETGLRFRGQRRAGSSHADVQPLTKHDSAVMKQIYGGHWSWSRRAILIQTPEGYAAGSMHGMPHGGDGIPGNQFKGHFCIHFDGTATHGSGLVDPGHQVMVHKAGGRLGPYLQSLNPDETAGLFLLAVNQKDRHLATLLVNPSSPDAGSILQDWLDPKVTAAKRSDPPKKTSAGEIDHNGLNAELHTRVGITRKGDRPRSVSLIWKLSRASPEKPWLIDKVAAE